MAEPNVYEVVDRYLKRDITAADLRGWLLGCVEWPDRWAPEDQRELGLTAMNLSFIHQDGEWTERALQ